MPIPAHPVVVAGVLSAFAQDPGTLPPDADRDPRDGVAFFAALGDEPLEVGATLTARVEIALDEGVSATDSGMPGFILQLDPPAGVELAGKRVTEYADLAKNEFLMEPWERLVKSESVDVEFTLDELPAEGATLGLVLVGYVASRPGVDDSFLRRRLELPLVPGAEARPGDDADSSWGPVEDLLKIGDRAPAFDLPLLEEGRYDLAESLGTSPLIVSTYRAFW